MSDSAQEQERAQETVPVGNEVSGEVINASGGMFEDHGQDEAELTHEDVNQQPGEVN